MGLSQLNNGSSENQWFRIITLMIGIFGPFIYKFFEWVLDWAYEWIYVEESNDIVSIKFPVHEVRVQKDSYSRDSSTRQLYSINYLAINDYIKDNLSKIDGINNLIEILNVCTDYYSSDTDDKNFVLIPSDSSEILIEPESKIYCKITSTEKSSDRTDSDGDKRKNKSENSTSNGNGGGKIKTYELQLFIKLQNITNDEKRTQIQILNKFIENCVQKYKDKNEEKHEGKHWIYEYSHSIKDEYSGPELIFKEYIFENNKDLETNIFFENKNKLIKYVDKFIYSKELVDSKTPNEYEIEYKNTGYTYKATFLFYGYPGCGKTSTIKAILNRTKRHGIIVNWSKIKTCEELEALFRNRTINHKEYDARELCYIVEDCDASKNNILLSRKKNSMSNVDEYEHGCDGNSVEEEADVDSDADIDNIDEIMNIDDLIENEGGQNSVEQTINEIEVNNMGENSTNTSSNKKISKKSISTKNLINKIVKKIINSGNANGFKISKGINGETGVLSKFSNDSLNLSCLLNILDGIIELHGVMVIFTTNHPEKLDEAFLRAGRIEFKQKFERANNNTMIEIIKSKFKNIEYLDEKYLNNFKFVEYVLSPAEIQSVCYQNDCLDDCLKELEILTQKNISRVKR